jgi:hypothetical protein
MVAEILPRPDNDDEQREDCEQVVQSWIVTMVAGFPAHRLFPPEGSTKPMLMAEPKFPRISNAGS